MKKLKLKPNLQRNNFECGLAATKTILDSTGVNLSEAKLRSILKPDQDKGIPPEKIIELLKETGYEYWEKNSATINDLTSAVDGGYYCLVVYQAWFWGKEEDCAKLELGHYSVVFGYDDNNLYLAEPGQTRITILGKRVTFGIIDLIKRFLESGFFAKRGIRKVSKDVFEKHWIDEDWQSNVYDHWFLAIRRPTH